MFFQLFRLKLLYPQTLNKHVLSVGTEKQGNFVCFVFNNQAPVVQKLDSAIHRINHYPVDNAIGVPITYPLDSDLSGG